MANNNATISTDNITQTAGTDRLTVLEDTIQPTDFFDGAGGFDIIIIGTAGNGIEANLSASGTDATHGFHHYEALTFRNTSGSDISIAKFAGDQFGTGLISTSLAVRGVNGTQQDITIETDSNFSASRWTFTNWEKYLDFIEIFGGSSGNVLKGSRANDSIDGGAGADTLIGGPGGDHLFGGSDADTFKFNRTTEIPEFKKGPLGFGGDQIFDFSHTEGDRIDVHNIDANTGRVGNQNFHFIGKQDFHHRPGELQVVRHGPHLVTVKGDINGDGKADFQIGVEPFDGHNLVKGDFVL
jgi:Ca2+-binding RTX toxin-like protein